MRHTSMRYTGKVLCCSIALAICAFASGGDKARKALTPDDYLAVEIPGEVQLSPDGKVVAYVVASIEGKQKARDSQIWVVAADGSQAPRQFTTAENATSPRWSPDGGSLAFLSARRDPRTGTAARPQVYVLPTAGGEARRITDLKNGVTAFQWSPDGKHLACVSKSGPGDSQAAAGGHSDLRSYHNPEYKADGVGFYDEARSHIWVVDLGTGAAKQITNGAERNDSDPQWSPDGTRIAFTGWRTDAMSIRNNDIWVVPSGGGTPLKVSDREVGIESVRWSPDAQRIAYVASADDVGIPKIWITSAAGGASILASSEVTYAAHLEWTRDGRGLYFVAPKKGDQDLFHIQLDTRQVEQLTSRITVRQVSFAEPAHRIAYTAADESHPGDLFVSDLRGGEPRQLTHLNASLLDELELERMEPFTYKGADGWEVEGFFMKPFGWREGKKYPMILNIHGGPNGMWGFDWSHDNQTFAAQGWAVLCLNPRGSSGYGEAFQRGVDKEWGGKAFQDVMAGVDAALARNPWIDPQRLAVTGKSFGGFMTDWIVTHTTRFKAAATLAGISNFISVEATRDGFYGHARDFGGDLYENFDLYWKYSPVHYAADAKTPTIVLHGENDHRVPIEQGEQFFRALRHFGVPAEIVFFPREGHLLRGEPAHAVDLMKWEIYWFNRFMEGKPDAVRPNAE
jgi:dipeptidyl aminopeptidase/acylaminoacyl peptidase